MYFIYVHLSSIFQKNHFEEINYIDLIFVSRELKSFLLLIQGLTQPCMKTKTLCFIFLSPFSSHFFAACLSFAFFPFPGSSVNSLSKRTSRLKTTLLFALLVFSCLSGLAQQTDSLSRDEAIEIAARALFDSKAKPIRQKQKQFEDNTGIKVQFRVEDASLDKLGGLSEHLFKLFQNFTSLQNTNANTITGELSLLKNDQLSSFMSYRTRTTADLSACLFPEKETQSLDDRYSKWLSGNLSASEENINEAPASVDEMYPAVMTDYEALRYKNKDCPGAFQQEVYDASVLKTAEARSANWTRDAAAISNTLLTTQEGFDLMKSMEDQTFGNLLYKHFINLNQSVNQCTAHDLESSCKILYAKTGIRFYFVTKTLNYFIPRDSLDAFKAAAVSGFSNNVSENLIVGLYLKMYDELTGTSCPMVLVSQKNGEWLSKADIDFVNYNNGGNYNAGTTYKFRNLIRNIPKPLILCYQVAKINGLLSTVYIENKQHVKGREQIYYHVFKIDKSFDEIKAINEELDALRFEDKPGLDIYSEQRKKELKEKLWITRFAALRNPQFNQIGAFKEEYLQNKQLVEAAALRILKAEYPPFFNNDNVNTILQNTSTPEDLMVGSCIKVEESDDVGDGLSVVSLLLTPTGLDVIPDALSVLYYAATGQGQNAMLAAGSVLLPGNINLVRKAVRGTPDLVHGLEAGEMLLRDAGSLKLVSQNANEVMTAFKLDPALSGSGLIQKIEDLPVPTAELLTTDPNKAKTFLNVTEHLDEPKRREFVNKFLDDPDFRNTVIKNPTPKSKNLRAVYSQNFMKSPFWARCALKPTSS